MVSLLSKESESIRTSDDETAASSESKRDEKVWTAHFPINFVFFSPWKINVEPKNGGSDDFPFQVGDFQGPAPVNFPG